MVDEPVSSPGPDVRYLAIPDSTAPYLLARVRWPDVAQAVSAGYPHWQHDAGLFDLPYSEDAVELTVYQAAEIAQGWGAELPSESAAEGESVADTAGSATVVPR